MANVINIETLDCQGVEVYARLTETQLRNRLNPADALFIVESPKVISVALDKGYVPVSIMCERRHLDGDAAPLLNRCPADMPVYVGDRDILARLTGYTLTRGVLCAMRRPADRDCAEVCRGATRIAVIDGVVDTTNIGAIFRSAAALGIDAVLLSGTSCDPFNRRSVRVSMGSVFLVPWAWIDTPLKHSLRTLGFKSVAMALRNDSVAIDSPILKAEPRLAIILGTEGDGLAEPVINDADYVARIPMSHNVDSLNVAAASAVAFWELTKQS